MLIWYENLVLLVNDYAFVNNETHTHLPGKSPSGWYTKITHKYSSHSPLIPHGIIGYLLYSPQDCAGCSLYNGSDIFSTENRNGELHTYRWPSNIYMNYKCTQPHTQTLALLISNRMGLAKHFLHYRHHQHLSQQHS